MKTKMLLIAPLFFLCVHVSAQYSSAVGLRFGYPASVSYKKFLNDKNAIELMAGIYFSDINLGAIYEIHTDIESIDNLKWYYGGGVQVGLYNNFSSSGVAVGLSGVLGLDYVFDDLPLNLSLDIMPTFFLKGSGYTNGYYNGLDSYGALSARYVLGSDK